jgi:hypothetical protein
MVRNSVPVFCGARCRFQSSLTRSAQRPITKPSRRWPNGFWTPIVLDRSLAVTQQLEGIPAWSLDGALLVCWRSAHAFHSQDHFAQLKRLRRLKSHARSIGFNFGIEDYDGGRVFIPLETFPHALLEILLCFSGRSLPHLIITFRTARIAWLPRTDKSHENDWRWRVVNIGLLFELPKPSGNITSHRVLLSLRECEAGARSRWPRGL